MYVCPGFHDKWIKYTDFLTLHKSNNFSLQLVPSAYYKIINFKGNKSENFLIPNGRITLSHLVLRSLILSTSGYQERSELI